MLITCLCINKSIVLYKCLRFIFVVIIRFDSGRPFNLVSVDALSCANELVATIILFSCIRSPPICSKRCAACQCKDSMTNMTPPGTSIGVFFSVSAILTLGGFDSHCFFSRRICLASAT